MSYDRDAFFIDGDWAAPASSDVLEVVSPHSEQVVARLVEMAREAFGDEPSTARQAGLMRFERSVAQRTRQAYPRRVDVW